MRSTRIYTAQPLGGDSVVELEPEPARHIARVLRMRAGDELTLFNGEGGEYSCEILTIEKIRVQVRTGPHQATEIESTLHLHLGIAISRGERMDWVIQKSTELGVSAITPLFSERTGVKLAGGRADRKLLHWQQVAISACEQCGRNQLPLIHALEPLQNWVAHTSADKKIVLHHRASPSAQTTTSPDSIALLVGPEGGLSEEEVHSAGQAGFESMRLGPRVLRTETAPVAAIAILQSLWGDMQPDIR